MAYDRLRVTGSRGNGNETARTITIEDDRAPDVLAQVLVQTGYLQTTRISGRPDIPQAKRCCCPSRAGRAGRDLESLSVPDVMEFIAVGRVIGPDSVEMLSVLVREQ